MDDAAVTPRFHGTDDGFHKEERALHEEFQLVEAISPRQFLDRDERLRPGGVGNKNVDRAESRSDFRDEAIHFKFFADIGVEEFSFAAGVANSLRDAFGFVGAGEIIDSDFRAASSERMRDGSAESARGAGDESNATGKFGHDSNAV